MQRNENPDVIYRSEQEKFIAVADEIERMNRYDVLLLKDGDEMVGTLHKETDDSVEFQLHESKQRDVVAQETRSSRSSAKGGRSWSAPSRSRRASG